MDIERVKTKVPLPTSLGSSANPLSQKLSHVLSNSFVDQEIRSALDALERGGFVNDANSRRELRPNIAMQELETNKSVLDDYKRLVDEMHSIKSGIDSIKSACSQMRSQANTVRGSSSQLLEQSAFLQEQKKKVVVKRRVLAAFRQKFALDDSELQILTSAEPIDEAFFSCLSKVTAIHENCSVLLVADTQTAGLEIMETMAKHLDSGYAKLHRWILKELKSTTAGATEANVLLRKALTVLFGKRDLYEKTLDHVSDSRRRVVVADFDQARTRGRLEANSQDCVRFLGDMLAWLHQAIASEREVLEMILGSAGRQASTTIAESGEQEVRHYRTMQNELVDRNFSLVMKPLQQRIDQVIVAQNDRVASLKAAILIRFYRDLIDRVLEKDASITTSLKNMEKSAMSRFMQSTRNRIASVHANPPEADLVSLESPLFLQDTIDDLAVVLDVLDGSFLETAEKEVEFTDVWDQLLRQCIETCVRMASEIQQPSSSIYLLNCITSMEDSLSTVTFTTRQLEMCRSASERCKQALVIEQHDYLLRNAGIITQIEALEENHSEAQISRLPEYQIDTLKGLTRQLGNFLPNALSDITNRLEQVKNKRYASQVNNEAVSRFANDYRKIEETVLAHIEFGRSVLANTHVEVSRVLGMP